MTGSLIGSTWLQARFFAIYSILFEYDIDYVKEDKWKILFFVDLRFCLQGSLLMLGGIQLHVVVCGLLMVHPDHLRNYNWLWNWWKSGKNMVISR